MKFNYFILRRIKIPEVWSLITEVLPISKILLKNIDISINCCLTGLLYYILMDRDEIRPFYPNAG